MSCLPLPFPLHRLLLQLLALSCLSGLAGGIAAAAADTDNTATTAARPRAVDTVLDTVIVTGSSIKRRVAESALPLQIITAAELTREGISSPEQLLMYLSSNGTGLDNLASNADVVGGAQRGNNGAASANLRGQGAAATLVLLNGRRVAAHGLNGGVVDVNQIPLAAIERVEILKEGASAVYGADAIGGVINFILKDNVEGLSVTAFADQTGLGGGDRYRASVVAGLGSLTEDHYHLMATLAYSNHGELRGDQRPFVNTFQPDRGLSVDTRGTPFATLVPLGIGPNTPDGTFISSAGSAPWLPGSSTVRASGGINPLALPGGPGCAAIDGMAPYDTALWNFPEAAYACAWDTGRAAVLQQPIDTVHLVSRGVFRFGEQQLSAEVTGSRANSAKRFSNLQLLPNTTTQNFALARTAAAAAVYDRVFDQVLAVFPSLAAQRGLPMAYRWRCLECGRREIDTTTDTGRAFIGMEGPLPGLEGWDYRSGVSYAFSQAKSTLGSGYYYRNTTLDANGTVIANGLIDALNTGLINPFLLPGESQSAAGLDELAAASAAGVTLYGGRFTMTQLDGALSGRLFSLPAGEALAAIGVDFRRETYAFQGDRRAAAARPVIIAAPFDEGNVLADAARQVQAVYAEVMAPLRKDLELTLAVRRDHYSGFGQTTNPNLALKYQPFAPLLFRASYNTGFRVPAFNQIFNAATESLYAGRDLADPGSCPGGQPDPTQPGCAVVQPVLINGGQPTLGPETAEQLNAGVVFTPTDRFSLSLDWWRIRRAHTIELLTLQQLADHYSVFQQRYLRDATGTLTAIDQRLINAGGSITEGLEISARMRGDALGGHWSAGIDGARLLAKHSRVVPGLPFGPSEVGVFTFAGDLGLRWKHHAYLSFQQGHWTASLSQLWRSGYTNQQLPGVASGAVTPPHLVTHVQRDITYHTSLSYQGVKALTVTAGIHNLFNAHPPFAITYDSNFGAGSSWEPRVADPRLRSFTLLVEHRF